MQFSPRARHALSIMLELAMAKPQSLPLALPVFADSHDLSISYLEMIFADLKRAGLVASVRGPGGGYHLARSPVRISLAEIVEAADSSGERVAAPRTDTPGLQICDRFARQICASLSFVSLLDLTEGVEAKVVVDGI